MADDATPPPAQPTQSAGPYRSAQLAPPPRPRDLRPLVLGCLVGGVVAGVATSVVVVSSRRVASVAVARPMRTSPAAVGLSTLPPLTDAVGLLVHELDLCVKTASGAVYCDARNVHPDLDPRDADRLALVPTGFPIDSVNVFRNDEGELWALQANGALHAAGNAQRVDAPRQRVLWSSDALRWELDHGTVRWAPLDSASTAMTGLPSLRALESNGDTLCGVGADGAVWCWAAARPGSPMAVRGLRGAENLLVLGSLGCALQETQLRCWSLAPLANGEPLEALAVPWPAPITRLVGYGYPLCAIESDGTVRCAEFAGLEATLPLGNFREFEGLHGARDLALRVGGACGLMADGHLRCAGTRLDSLLNGARRHSDRFAPAVGLPRIRQLVASAQTVCALGREGEALCWGANDRGQIDDAGTDRPTPTRIDAFRGARAIGVGDGFVCGLGVDGCVTCRGARDDSATPLRRLCLDAEANASGAFTSLTVSSTAMCARAERGDLRCRAFASQGEQPWVDPSLGALRDVAPMGDGFCAFDAHRDVVCWTVGTDGHALVRRPAVRDIASLIAHGSGEDCALRRDGRIVCWADGPLREDDAAQVPSDAVRVWGDRMQFYLLRSEGRVKRIGDDHDVSELEGVTTLAMGDGVVCALHEDGTVSCAGDNARGQLGDGSPSPDIARDAVISQRGPRPDAVP